MSPPVFERLQDPVPAGYRGMTFSHVAPLFEGLGPDSEAVAIGAVMDGRPVGLGLAMAPQGSENGEVISLFVNPSLWRRGVGMELLRRLEEFLRERRCGTAHVAYSTQSQSTAALERILAKLGWPPPRTQTVLAQIATTVVEESWVRELHVQPPYELFPWSELRTDERAALEQHRAEVTPSLWPFMDDAPLEPATSLGLRHGSEVIGWLVTHRMAPKVVRFSALYVRERWRKAALTFALLAEGTRRLPALGPEMSGTLAVQIENTAMLRFLERKLRPHALLWHERRVSVKRLI